MGDKFTIRIDAAPGEHSLPARSCNLHIGRDMSVTMEFLIGEGAKVEIVLSPDQADDFAKALSPDQRKRTWEDARQGFNKRRH